MKIFERARARPSIRSLAGTTLAVLGLGVLACSSDVETAPTPPPSANPAPSCVSTTVAPSADVVLTLDPSRLRQTIEGFGSTERLFDDPHVTNTFNPATRRAAVVLTAAEQGAILSALYRDLGLTRVRYNPRDVEGTDVDLEVVNDNADPEVTDLSKFDFSWKKNDGHIAYVKAAIPYGLTTWFASPLTLETWMNESNPAEYVEWAMAILRRWRSQGVEMPYYSIVNEPGYTRSGSWSGAFLLEITKRLGAKLRAEGFRTKLVVPDDVSPLEALSRLQVILPDAEARQSVSAIAYHLYGTTGRDQVKQLAVQYGLPVWMTEFYQTDWMAWATTMHEMLATYDATAIDYMWGFFGQWEAASQLITIRYSGNTYTGFDLTKRYYAMGQYSRFVRPGARRIDATSSDHGVLVTAYTGGAQPAIVVLNTGTTDKTVRVDLGQGGACSGSVQAVRTSAGDSWRSLPAIPLSAPRFLATLPAASITTFLLPN